MMSIISVMILVLIINLFFATSAFAYLDPNAGGVFLQVIVPIIFGTAAAITVFWRRLIAHVKNFISRFRGLKNSSDE